MKRDTVWLEWLILGGFGLWLAVLVVRIVAHGGLRRDDLMGFVWLVLAAGLAFLAVFAGALVVDGWRWLTTPLRHAPAPEDGLLRRYLANRRGSRLVRHPDGTEEAEVPCREETAGVLVLPDGRVGAWVPVEGEQTHSLDLGRTTLPRRVKESLGIDQKGPDALAGLVVDQKAEEALRLLFGPFQCSRLWLSEGRLHAETGLRSSVVSAGWLDQVLDGLFRVAALLDTMQVVVRKATPRAADRTLCPFCHDDVTPAEATACPGCGTQHHSECWEEGAGCTILGCARNPRKGVQARAR